ncbi:MAG: Mur ligase family protein [Candidatus Saccharimonadales bacterium]
MQITNFDEARSALKQFYNHAAEYKLDAIRDFMAFLGNPQDSVRVIHVAGTSGKTSTAYYIAGLLKAAGYSTGLTTSPHVDEINERVQIDLLPLPEPIFCEQLTEFLQLVEESRLQLSYFEVMVAFAYWYFAKVRVDVAVIEVGLGGRIDGTNVVTRTDKLCVITNIGFDHTKILGDTLSAITREKAGIILAGSEVFTHQQDSEIFDVITEVCHEHNTTLHVVVEAERPELAELPRFQRHNIQLAIAATSQFLAEKDKTLTPVIIEQATHTYIPARMERVTYRGKRLILDGAHNGQKLSVLLKSLTEMYPRQDIAAIVAFVAGDEPRMRQGLQEIMLVAKHIIVTEFSVEQDVPKHAVPATEIATWCKEQGFESVEVETQPLVALDILQARSEPLLLVTGSFYLLNHIRPHIIKQ